MIHFAQDHSRDLLGQKKPDVLVAGGTIQVQTDNWHAGIRQPECLLDRRRLADLGLAEYAHHAMCLHRLGDALSLARARRCQRGPSLGDGLNQLHPRSFFASRMASSTTTSVAVRSGRAAAAAWT